MLATTRPAPRFRMKFRSELFVIYLILSCVHAQAQTVSFGARTLNMPAPEGFVAVAKTAPRYMEAAQAYLPPGNRLVESFVPPDAAKSLAAGQPVALERYFQLQTLRKADGKPLSAEEFRGATAEIEASFAKALKEVDAGRLAENGNAQVRKMTANDPQLSLSGIESQGVYRREPWGIFFTVKSHVAVGSSGASSDLICAGALTLINHQLMYLNGYAQLDSPEDKHWVEQAVSAWADMVHAANPDDPAVAAKARPPGGFSWSSLLGRTLIGAVLGALVGIVVTLVRKRKP